MNKELESFERIKNYQIVVNAEKDEVKTISELLPSSCNEVETALKQAQEDKKMLDIFKNALTVERDIPPELEIKESEKGCSYIFKEAVKIHENRIEETLKKALKEWVLKNAFPKELKALEIIKENLNIDEILLAVKGVCKTSDYDLVKEVLENV